MYRTKLAISTRFSATKYVRADYIMHAVNPSSNIIHMHHVCITNPSLRWKLDLSLGRLCAVVNTLVINYSHS